MLGFVAVGVALLLGGAVLERPAVAILGLASWVAAVAAATLGLRHRVAALMQLELALHGEQAQVRESQGRLHGRVAWLNKARSRNHQAVLEALELQAATLRTSRERQAASFGELRKLFSAFKTEHQRELIQQRWAVEGAQKLFLSAYRDTDASIEKLRSQLEGALARRADEYRELRSEVESLAETQAAFREVLANLSGELKRNVHLSETVSTHVDRISGDVASLKEGQGALVGDILHLAGAVKKARKLEAAAAVERKEMRRSLESLLAVATQTSASSESATGILKSVSKEMETLASVERRLRHVDEVATSGSRGIQKAEHQIVQEVEAVLYLQKLLDLPAPAPLLGGWAMDPVGMLQLVLRVLQTKPKLIVECGSGASTVWLGHALKQNGRGRLISLEHLEDFAGASQRALASHKLQDVAEVLFAPIDNVMAGGEAHPWYSLENVKRISGIELLVVDGPPGKSAPLARYPALPIFHEAMASEAFVVLDDANRPEERKIIERWRDEYCSLGDAIKIGPRTVGFEWKRV